MTTGSRWETPIDDIAAPAPHGLKAMLLAAGLGTRLRPLTDTVPKILVPVAGVPMLDRLLAGLEIGLWSGPWSGPWTGAGAGGIREIALNTHHLAPAVMAHLTSIPEHFPGLSVRAFHETDLLGTGGALVNVRLFWGQSPLLAWNGDVLAGIDLAALTRAHEAYGLAQGVRGTLATLVVQARDEPAQLLLDGDGALRGVESPKRGGRRVAGAAGVPGAGSEGLHEMAYCGVALLSPEAQGVLARPGAFDLIDALLDAVDRGGTVTTYDMGPGGWGTTGSPEELKALERLLAAEPLLLARFSPAR